MWTNLNTVSMSRYWISVEIDTSPWRTSETLRSANRLSSFAVPMLTPVRSPGEETRSVAICRIARWLSLPEQSTTATRSGSSVGTCCSNSSSRLAAEDFVVTHNTPSPSS